MLAPVTFPIVAENGKVLEVEFIINLMAIVSSLIATQSLIDPAQLTHVRYIINYIACLLISANYF
jgi:hypothetical protein